MCGSVVERYWCAGVLVCRQHIEELAKQLENFQSISVVQQANVQRAADDAVQQEEDAAWVQQMTSEIQALSARITSLLRELLVRPIII